MKDGVGRFASFTLGVANSAAHSASPSNARTHARTASRLGPTDPTQL